MPPPSGLHLAIVFLRALAARTIFRAARGFEGAISARAGLLRERVRVAGDAEECLSVEGCSKSIHVERLKIF